MTIKTKTLIGIALVLIMLFSSTIAVVAAVPVLKDQPAASSTGYSTYIVAFKDQGTASAAAQSQVESLIDSYNGKIIDRYSLINGMAVTLPDDKVDTLKAMSNVKYVEKEQTMSVLLDKAVPQIGGDQVWAAGYTGQGVKVCVIDTGVDATHPDLDGNKVVGWVDYVNGKTTPYDDHGHGTHVSSTICGTGAAENGKYKGGAHLQLSGTLLRKLLSEGKPVPAEFSKPEVIAVLKEYYESLDDQVEVKLHGAATGDAKR